MTSLPPFTPFDNKLLEALARKGLSGTEWDFIAAVMRYTAGFEGDGEGQRRDWHHLSLSFVACFTGRHRITLQHAAKTLEQKGIVTRRASRGHTAIFRMNPPEQWATVSNRLTVSISADETVEEANIERNPDTVSENTNTTVCVDETECFKQTNRTVSVDETKKEKKRKFKEKEKEKGSPLKIGPQGPFPQTANAVRGATSFSKSLKDSGGLRPATHQGEKPAGPQKPNPAPLIQLLEEEHGIKVSLTKTERREIGRLMEKCNQGLFQSAFIRVVCDTKGKDVPDHLKRPGDRCKLFFEYAAGEAERNGGRL